MNANSSSITPAGGAMTGPMANTMANTMASSGRASFGTAAASAISMKWAALSDAAEIVAMLAGQEPEKPSAASRNFPALIRDTGGWRYDHARKGIEDLAAFMEPGLAALLAVNARGANPAVPANALWREYWNAKQALLALAPPSGTMGPRRSA